MVTMRDETKHPWVLGGLRIARALLARVDEHARAGYALGEESCGLLVGPANDAALLDAIVPMVNRARALHEMDPETYPRSARTYFDLDPMKFARAVETGEADGRPVKVLYHSHLDVGAYFSDTDAAAAKMGGDEPAYDLAYLVTSVKASGVDDHKLFVWHPEVRAFAESELRVEG
jgi:[CysO sulfur-carrier protein]-S-L-cysteine hydrolase